MRLQPPFPNFAWWQGALSSWNIQYSSENKLWALASNFVSNTVAYLVAFIIPTQMCNLPMPFDVIQLQIITLVGCLIVGEMHWGLNASWGLLRTRLFPACFWIVKMLSSLNMTLSQSSLVQFKCFFALAILAFLSFSDTFGFFFALYSLKPLRSNLFQIVDVDTSTPVLWRHSWQRSELVRRRLDRESLTRALSCRMVDFIFLPLPGFSSNFSVSFHRFSNFNSLEQPTSDAIFRSDIAFLCG